MMNLFREQSAVLLGEYRSGIWLATMKWITQGTHDSVSFDWALVLTREEKHGDVLGFFHTHPAGHFVPSQRDHKTMSSWVSCFGKPLLCLIECENNWRAFEHDGNNFTALREVVPFSRRRVVVSR
ncbi:MAG: Mov34/MPN/PAD-1 family protein [Candidatus Obscuribacterales bacterium]|nr:Mov34/MPN/PAD-1 family protein [Candidatus Obscuribacterales bacterium]